MDMEKLVELITKEVMKRIEDQEIAEDIKKPRVLVLDSSDSDNFLKVKNELESKYAVDSYEDSKSDVNDYEAIVLNSLCNKELVNIALGMYCGSKEETVVQGILSGKKIYVLEEGIEYRKYASTANQVFYNLYKDYENKILCYGISVVKENDLCSILFNEKIKVQTPKLEESIVVDTKVQENIVKFNNCESTIEIKNKKLISEVDIKRLYKSGVEEVVVSKKSLITPLAQDFIRINRLKVTRA